ncbi:LacI family DNA-binding transcriptional regulator [Friedmanniella luteola]|uniref:LacI family DNA-binding transcriptional regulator n=1 Tax=Friedmanniella luteola TaxID=546871 RepID=UPI001E5F5DCF|nr:LacI family DNA-binding transcriptional regulator [Friedmanniella luteola]
MSSVARKASISMKDVAALAKVSLGTVSNVVNSPELVSPPTRERVETAIAKLGWVPNASARQLRAGRSSSVGLVVMDIANPFFTDVLLGVEDHVLQRGYSVQVGNSASQPQREDDQLRLFEQQRVRGVLCAPIWGVNQRVDDLRRRGIPVVVVDRAPEESGFCSVSVDDVEGGRLAVDHLIRLGHRSIALVGGPGRLQQIRDRRLGADLARAEHGDVVDLLALSTSSLDTTAGVLAADELAAMPDRERPTAVFAANDLLAIGLLQGFVTHGLRVPEDMALIGYDDISFAAAAAVPLSSVRQPRVDLGRRAAELLFEEIEALDDDRPHEHQSVRFTPTLVVRRSTAGGGQGRRG